MISHRLCGLKFRTAFAGWFWLRVSPLVAVEMFAGAGVIQRLDWGCKIGFQVSSLTVPPYVGFSTGSLSVLVTWWLTFSRVSNPEESKVKAAMSLMA